MLLFVIRHAKASERDSQVWPDDSMRPLTKGGIRKFERLAEQICEIHEPPQIVLSSSFARAWSTARILSKVARWPDPIRCQSLECDHDDGVEATRAFLALRSEESIAIVGHEPMLSDFVAELLGSSGPAIVMNKGGVAILEVNDPKQLAAGESFPGSAASLVALIDPSWVAQGRKKR